MIRTVITIDEEKCNGCGLCVNACHEGAIALVDGKARLMRDDFCDGLGDCLPACPADAITFTKREAAEYDPVAVANAKKEKSMTNQTTAFAEQHTGCPGSRMRTIEHRAAEPAASDVSAASAVADAPAAATSALENWPVQIKLAPTRAPYFDGANLLIAADCCSYAYGNFHHDFIRNRTVVIGCPKLDGTDYAEKLAEIIATNDIKSVTITRMEVPCCGGLEQMAKQALQMSGKFIPWQVVTFSLDGRILD